MRVMLIEQGWQDYVHWQQHDNRMVKKIDELLKGINRQPFLGLVNPEALKYNLGGYWSRRINQEHRLVYRLVGDVIHVIQCRYHY